MSLTRRRILADRLLERGDPYGELLALACREDPGLREELDVRVGEVFGPGVRLSWHEGWIDGLELQDRYDVLEQLASEDELGGLTTFRWSGPVDRRLAEWLQADGEALEVVEIRGGGALEVPLDELFSGPDLRSLTLDLPEVDLFGPLDLPGLETLDLWTARPPIGDLAESALPALRSLRLGAEEVDDEGLAAWAGRSVDELVVRQDALAGLARVGGLRVRERLVLAGPTPPSQGGLSTPPEVVLEAWSASQQDAVEELLGRPVRLSQTWPVGLEHEVLRQARRRAFGAGDRSRTLRRAGRSLFVGDGAAEEERVHADSWSAAYEHVLRRRALEGLGWTED